MAQNITLLGASYSAVPAVQLPKTGGGSALFADPSITTAVESDVTNGKTFLKSDGSIGTGTATGSSNDFVVTLSWDDDYFGQDDGAWVPDCTIYELQDACQGGKNIVFVGEYGNPCSWFQDDDYVFVYQVFTGGGDNEIILKEYWYTTNGIQSGDDSTVIYPNFDSPSKTYTPTESQQSETITYDPNDGYNGIDEVNVTVNAIPSNYVGSGITQRSSSDLSASGATVSVPSGYYANNASATVTSGSATTPATTITANPSISVSSGGLITATASASQSVTPTISAGYVSSGTAGTITVSGSNTSQLTTQGAQTIYPSTSDQTINSGRYLTGNQTIKGVAIANLTADNIKSGVTVTVGDSADADRVASVTGTYSGGGSVSYDTKTATASNYPVSLQFTSMKGQPKFFVVRLNAQVSSSGSTTYYYIVDIASNGTTTHGNCFRIGSTRRVDNIASGYSWSYSNSTLTITSSASSRSASPGAFYNGSYELMYAY